MWMLWLMLLLSSLAAAKTSSNVKPGCQEKCGDVTVPYPFGIDNAKCAMNRNFFLNCSRRDFPPKLMIGELGVFNLSIENGSMTASIFTARRCYDGSGNRSSDYNDPYVSLGSRPLRFSDTRNKLTAFGCDTLAYMGDPNGNFWSGCISLCTDESAKLNESSCSGIGCCQIPLPKGLKALNLTLRSINNHQKIGKFMPCDYALLADETFNIAKFRASKDKSGSNVTIEWVVKETKCPDDPNSKVYGCGDNTNCDYSENGKGYRCKCKPGFQGNPYLGCDDIDECLDTEKHHCEGNCKNTIGDYTCDCPIGMYGDGKVDCRGFRITTIVAVIGPGILSVIVGIMMFIACIERRKQKNFLKNGGEILKHQPVRIFSAAELVKATKNYDDSNFLGEGGFGSVYKGVLPDNTQIAVKKPKETDKVRINQEFQQEMGVVSRINHKNVVKILGLCLQTKVPVLVYEFVSNGTLSHHIHDKRSQVLRSWKICLRIAAEIASALDYFHSLASPTIIHGDVKSSNILLDDNYTAKVADFGASVLISPDQTVMATKIQGTFGYLDPEYLMTGNLTEKSDVYSFGVVLVELLTGVKPGSHMTLASNEKISIIQYFLSSIENSSLRQILNFPVADESEMEEVQIVAELASECLRSSGAKRPTMEQVSEELDRLKKLHENLWAQENTEETEHLLGESSTYAKPVIAQQNTQTFESFDIENYSYSV